MPHSKHELADKVLMYRDWEDDLNTNIVFTQIVISKENN